MTFPPDDRTTNLVIWTILGAVVLVWVVVTTSSRRLPTFGDLVRFLRGFWVFRWALLTFWVWLGWHLLIRTTA